MGRPKVRRKNASGDDRHWLGEGLAGQEVLLHDLDPYVAAAAPGLSKEVSKRVRTHELRGQSCMLWLPSNPLCPLIPVLSAIGPVSLVTEEPDEVVSAAAQEFGVKLFDSSFEEASSYNSPHSLVLCLEQVWTSSSFYALHVRQSLNLVSANGAVICLLKGRKLDGETVVFWNEKDYTSLDQLVTRGVFPLSRASTAQAVCLGDYFSSPGGAAKEQQKLFKDFYGKGIEKSFLNRMAERDISQEISADNFAVLLYYEADEHKQA